MVTSSEITSTDQGQWTDWAGRALSEPADDVTISEEDTTYVSGVRWICQENERKYSTINEDFPLLDENADVIWPGAALQGKSLTRATPDPITAPRGPGDLIWAQINGSELSGLHVQKTSLLAIKTAADSLLEAQPKAVPADVQVSVKRVRSDEDLRIAVNASASWFGLWKAHANFSLESGLQYNYFLVTIRQNIFTLVFQRPELPHDFFAVGTQLEEIAPHVGPDNPPAYVSRVTYGRVFYLLVRSTEKAEDISGTLTANFQFGLAGSDLDASTDYFKDLKEVEVQVYVYGGTTLELQDAIGGGLIGLNAFRSALKEGEKFKLAKPVFATIRSVSTDELIRNGYTIGYTFRDCTPYALCSPILVSPTPDATSMDNGCRCDSNPVSWKFDWMSCSGATSYQLQVAHPDYGVISRSMTNTYYTLTWGLKYIPQRKDWKWRVRAKGKDVWGPWSPYRDFALQAVDSDCKTGVTLYEHEEFNKYKSGKTQFIDWKDLGTKVPHLGVFGMNDNVTSLRIHNLRGVTLYVDDNYTGQSYFFDHNCPNVQQHGTPDHGFPNDKATSLKMAFCSQ